ncbi:type III polyketide synthase [Microvirga massiliensis]|uniref:type III polyketide synthase n=1 Tax=Microvirga massiliensis TaxID=1033741 RepID=UPI00062BB2C8|nr:type III polyketide synthase [Microvirga massiliensis]
MTTAFINRIGTAVPPNDVHERFIHFVDRLLPDRKAKLLFKRMSQRAGIEHRYSVLEPNDSLAPALDRDGLYQMGHFAGTAARMAQFETKAADLAERTITALGLNGERSSITHLIVASCTGFAAPGLDQILVERLGLNPIIERTMVGFMGCAAAVNALKVAHHIVRSEPSSKVLVLNVELCTLHLHETADLESLLTALLFGDGCAAALVSTEPAGAAIENFRTITIPNSRDLITWRVGDRGFEMTLSGEVPARIAGALRQEATRNDDQGLLRGQRPSDFERWAVHAGGRTILDAVEHGLALGPEVLSWSRGVLRDFGNMSSATLMFVLQRMMGAASGPANGMAIAFGPGLVAETFCFSLPG